MVFLREFRNILKITALLFFATFFTACRSYKNVPYFYDVPDSIYKNSSYVGVVAYTDPKIQPNDLLQVSVQTLDPSASAMSGASTTATYTVQAFSSGNSGTISGFMVDKDGMIELPLVGKIPVAGKTTSEARELIRSRAAIYYKEPVVNVRFANFNISVLGEVSKPSQYVVPNEKVSILDAIAMAGDLTIYGRRDNVLLIRETDGAKQFTRFNLNSTDLFQSPNFYLRQGDVVYVQPSKARVAATDMQRIRNLTIATTLINLAVILLIRLR
jgi:polysaccharide export outer membrane protein